MKQQEIVLDFIEQLSGNTQSGNLNIDEIVEHHGIKGMKWGVRQDKGHEGQRAKTKKIAKLDKKFVRSAFDPKTTIRIYNRAAQLTNDHDIARINNKPEYKNVDFTRNSPIRQKYYKEHQQAMLNNLEKAAGELGTNASGTQKYTILEGIDGQSWNVAVSNVKHADDILTTIKLHFDDMGRITSVEFVKPIEHGEVIDDLMQNILEHYGKKGMRWGHRSQIHIQPGKKASADFKKTVPLRNIKPHRLTNKQLQTVNTRINLEQNYRKLNPSKIQKGHASVKTLLAFGTTAVAVHALINSPAGKAAIAAGKKMIEKRF